MARRRNPRWDIAVAVGGTLLGVGVLALGFRALARSAAALEPSHGVAVDIDAAMPTPADFPSGWSFDDVGAYASYAEPGSSAPSYRFAWKILRLPTPSTLCSPPCAWVAVWAGANNYGATTQGWTPVHSRDAALDLLDQKHNEVI